MLFTHVHIDHLQGFMFFNPLYSHSKKVNLFGPVFGNKSFYESIKGLMESNLFPVGIEAMVGINSINILQNNWEKEYVLKEGKLNIQAKILNVHPRSGVVVYKFSLTWSSFFVTLLRLFYAVYLFSNGVSPFNEECGLLEL